MNAAHIKHDEQMARLLPPCPRAPASVAGVAATAPGALRYQPSLYQGLTDLALSREERNAAMEAQDDALEAARTDEDRAEACPLVLCSLQDQLDSPEPCADTEALCAQLALMERIDRVSLECCAARLARAELLAREQS